MDARCLLQPALTGRLLQADLPPALWPLGLCPSYLRFLSFESLPLIPLVQFLSGFRNLILTEDLGEDSQECLGTLHACSPYVPSWVCSLPGVLPNVQPKILVSETMA